MANEVEALELAKAQEGLANEEISHDESSSAEGVSVEHIAAGGSTENVKELKPEIKTETEVMSEANEKQDSGLTVIKETVTEKVKEQKEPLKLAGGDSDIIEKPDSETANEEIKESVLEMKPEPISGSVATGELKLADELIPRPEPVPSDEPQPVDELPSTEPVPNDKPQPADELPSTKPVPNEEPQPADELQGTELVPSDEPQPADELQGTELVPSDEPQPADELPSTEPVPNDEPQPTNELPSAEPVPNDEPQSPDEPQPANELPSTVPVPNDEPQSADELQGTEPVPSDKPIGTGETKLADELKSKSEVVASDELEPDELTEGPELKPGDEQIPEPEPKSDDEVSPGLEPEPGDEPKPDDEVSPSLEPEPGDEQVPDQEAEPDSEDEEKEVVQDVDNNEEKIEKPLDDDQDRRNPQYIPKGGAFYEHDNRTSFEDVENKDPQDNEKKKKSWKESKDSEEWLHDCYNESEQRPKSTAEIIETYGYDIRSEDAPPRARRRRKYGRGPDKYERSWEDEQAYQIKQNNIGRRGKKKLFGKDEFPPLPNQKFDSSVSKPVQKASMRKKEEVGSKSINVKLNGNEKSPITSQASRSSHSGNHNSLHSFNSNRKNYSSTNKKVNDNDIKPFRNDDGKWKISFKHGRQDDFPKPIKTQSVRHTDPPFKRSMEANKNSTKDPHISHITDGINQMTFLNKQTDIRDIRLRANGPEESKINEPEVDNPANRQNPKRYSKIRKGFTGIFPPEEVAELDQSDIHKLQQEQQKSQHLNMTQPLNMQNVMKRYAGTYGNLSNCVSDFVPGNSSYLQARPIISGIPQQALSPQGIHQQALSPQGIPQQALSPQVPGLPTIELQQNPLGQPNFVPQPMYVDAHFTSDVMGSFTGYSPYSGNQTGDVYQPTRGITYYNTECQTSGQKRPPPRRQNAAIPIVPPPE